MMFDTSLKDALQGIRAYQSEEVATNKSVEEIFYEKLQAYGFNLTELREFLEADGNIAVAACAGAGKTTALVLRVIYDFIRGKYIIDDVYYDDKGNAIAYKRNAKVLVSTFLKTGAVEIKQRFMEWCEKLGVSGIDYSTITFTTLHAELYSALKAIGVKGTIWENTGDVVRLTMQHFNIHNRNSRSSKANTIEDVSDMQSIFTYYRNWLDDTRYKHPLMEDYGLDAATLEAAVKWYIEYISLQGAVDFEMLEELLYQYMQKNPDLYTFLAKRYDFVYVDEFQDTSQLQYAVLRPYFDGAKRTIVIGDDDQTIYSWRGSDIDIIVKQYARDYNPTVIKLSVNYRCGNNILQAVVPSISINTKRIPKTLTAAREGGTVFVNTDAEKNLKLFIDGITDDLAMGRTVAVLSRTNADLLVPTILLEMFTTIKFALSKNVSLGTKIPRMIFGVMDLLTGRYTEEFPRLLKGFFTYKNYNEVEHLCNILSSNPQMTLFDIPIEDCKQSLPGIYPFLAGLFAHYGDGDDAGKRCAYKYMLHWYNKSIFVKDNSFHIKARELSRFMIMLIDNVEFLGNKPFSVISELFRKELPDRLLARTKYKDTTLTTKCMLTTVHECKGKEWDSVYIWNDNDGTFPVILANNNDKSTYEEERRLHYIAWTRARTKLVILADINRLSPFLLECNLTGAGIENAGDLLNRRDNNVMQVHNANKPIEDNVNFSITEDAFYIVFNKVLDSKDSEEKAILQWYAANGALNELSSFWYDYTKSKKAEDETVTYAEILQLIRYSGKNRESVLQQVRTNNEMQS